jgi:tetratricopeptide (TPR) repeat protein
VEQATALAEQALSGLREAGNRRGQAYALATLGEAARLRGEYDRAAALLEDCLVLRRDLGDPLRIAATLESQARLARSRGHTEEAIRLYGAAAALRAALGTPLPPIWQPGYEEEIARLRAAVGPDTAAALWDEGRTMALSYLPTVVEPNG